MDKLKMIYINILLIVVHEIIQGPKFPGRRSFTVKGHC